MIKIICFLKGHELKWKLDIEDNLFLIQAKCRRCGYWQGQQFAKLKGIKHYVEK